MESTIARLADELNRALEYAERDDGTEFIRLADGSPEWMREVVHACHKGWGLPDDWRYRLIDRAADALANADGDRDEAREYLEPDGYTSAVTAWLHSHPLRVVYLTEAIHEYGGELDGNQALALAQSLELDEILGQLFDALAELEPA